MKYKLLVLKNTIAQFFNQLQCQLLGLRACELAGTFLCLRRHQDAVGNFYMLARGIHALLHGALVVAVQQPADHGQHGQDKGRRDDAGLGHEPQVAKRPHTRCPDAVVLEEATGIVVAGRAAGRGVGRRAGAADHGVIKMQQIEHFHTKSRARRAGGHRVRACILGPISLLGLIGKR